VEFSTYLTQGWLLPRFKASQRQARRSALFSRIYYGAMYTIVIYQSGNILSAYKSCVPGTAGKLEAPTCSVAALFVNGTSDQVVINSIDFDTPMIVCATVLASWSFVGSLRYTLHEKNAASPAFTWLPSYDAVRYTIKTFIAGAGSMFKLTPTVTMPTYLIGFSSLIFLTYRLQPCQGQGRRANNLRLTGFVIGTWLSACGIVFVLLDAERRVLTLFHVLLSYFVLVGGCIAVARVAWKINDKKARQVAIPDLPWRDLIAESSPRYVREVTADCILLYAESKGGKKLFLGGDLMLYISQLVQKSDTKVDNFISTRLAAAYLLFSCGGDYNVANRERVRSGILTQCKENRKQKRSVTAVKRFTSWGIRASLSMFESPQSASRNPSVEYRRIANSETFKHSALDSALCAVINALVCPTFIRASTKRRISLALAMYSMAVRRGDAFYEINPDDRMDYMHALIIARGFCIACKDANAAILDRCVQHLSLALATILFECEDALKRGLEPSVQAAYFISDEYRVGVSESIDDMLIYFVLECAMKFFEGKRHSRRVKLSKTVPLQSPTDIKAFPHCIALIDTIVSIATLEKDSLCANKDWDDVCMVLAKFCFSTNFRLHAAAYMALQNIFKRINGKNVCTFDFFHVVSLLKVAKGELEPLLTVIASKVRFSSIVVSKGGSPSSRNSFKRTPTNVEDLGKLANLLALQPWTKCRKRGLIGSKAYWWESLLSKHLTAFAANALGAEVMHHCCEVWKHNTLQVHLGKDKALTFHSPPSDMKQSDVKLDWFQVCHAIEFKLRHAGSPLTTLIFPYTNGVQAFLAKIYALNKIRWNDDTNSSDTNTSNT